MGQRPIHFTDTVERAMLTNAPENVHACGLPLHAQAYNRILGDAGEPMFDTLSCWRVSPVTCGWNLVIEAAANGNTSAQSWPEAWPPLMGLLQRSVAWWRETVRSHVTAPYVGSLRLAPDMLISQTGGNTAMFLVNTSSTSTSSLYSSIFMRDYG